VGARAEPKLRKIEPKIVFQQYPPVVAVPAEGYLRIGDANWSWVVKRVTRVSVLIGVVVSAFLIAALAGRERLLGPSFQRDEAPRDLFVTTLIGKSVYWLDNDTLVFSGSRGKPIPAFPIISERQYGRENIYIWRLGEEPKVYKPEKWQVPGTLWGANYLCAQDGQIYFSIAPMKFSDHRLRQWSTTVMIGPPGHESPAAFSLGSDILGETPINLLSQNTVGKRCTNYVDPQMAQHKWVISRHSDTILDFGAYTDDMRNWNEPIDLPLRLIRVRDRHSVVLSSVDHRWARSMCAESLSWEDAFVVWRCEGLDATLLDVHSYPIWKIKTDGTVIRTTMHTGDLWGVHLVPSRSGNFVVASTTQTMTKERRGGVPEEAGLYSVDDHGELHLLVHGDFYPMAISPNGCLGAFATRSKLTKAEHLVVFDLCKAAQGKGWLF